MPPQRDYTAAAYVSTFFLGLFFAAGLFYLTPLRHVVIVEPTIRDIPATTFYEAYQRDPERYMFVDVRPADVFNKSHALGSINIPLHTLYTERKFLPKTGKEIVLICSGGSASGVAYSYLEHYGFRNLHRIEGGIESWQQAGLPLNSTIPPSVE